MSQRRIKWQCTKCQREGCRLYRQYQTFLDHIELMCRACAMVDQKKTEAYLAEYGEYSIGWMVAACPDKLPVNGKLPRDATFWGYTSVPQDKIAWWNGLPK